jgi:hypothetical protein
MTTLTFSTWTAALSARGWTVLSPSHAVPVQLWLRSGDTVLHLLARGTRVVLRRYAASDLTSLLLRSACDCAEHRTAGAVARTVLAPGTLPLEELVLDGRTTFGWTSYEAGLLDVPTAAGVLEALMARMTGIEGRFPGRTPTLDARSTSDPAGGHGPVATGRAGSLTQPLQLPG